MKILIIEDDIEVAKAVRQGLDGAGYRTQVVRDGERGLRVAQTGTFSLVILDLILPSIDGIEICRQLRRSRYNVPIVIVSDNDTVSHRINGLEAGADDYLVKPFSFDELLARVRALLRREHAVRSSVIEIDDLIVDTRSRSVSRAGCEIRLSDREYTLLEALATHAGRVLTREVIHTRVWHDDWSVSNTVEVCIKNLRKKIDKDSKNKLIYTVYGVGYILRTESTR